MDIDYIYADKKIQELKTLLRSVDNEKQKAIIVDEIGDFVDKLVEEWTPSCFNCKHVVSTQSDLVTHVRCDKTGRDFTYGKTDTEICELFEDYDN